MAEHDRSDEYGLLEQARDDPAAFGALYDRYVTRIYSFALRQTGDSELAQDITSSTFEKVLRHLREFRWQGVSFGAWLYKIAHNEIIQQHRRQRFFLPLLNIVSQVEVETTIQNAQQEDELHRAIRRLSRSDQELIDLRFFQGLSSEEVAAILGCSVKNVYVRLHRALSRLRTQLEQTHEKLEERYVSS